MKNFTFKKKINFNHTKQIKEIYDSYIKDNLRIN